MLELSTERIGGEEIGHVPDRKTGLNDDFDFYDPSYMFCCGRFHATVALTNDPATIDPDLPQSL